MWPIQSTNCNVRDTTATELWLIAYILWISKLSITKKNSFGKVWPDNGLRLSNFSSKMVQNLPANKKIETKKTRSWWSLQIILLCMVGELAGGGTMTVAVGVSDMWQLTRNMWHLTHDMWQPVFITHHISFIITATITMTTITITKTTTTTGSVL